VIGLRDEKVVHVYAEFAGVAGIERMFGVDESGLAAEFLSFGDDLQGERSLTARFRAVDFDDAAAGKPPTPRAASIERQPLGMTLTGTSTSLLPSRMIRALAVRLLDNRNCGFEVLHFFVGHCAPQ